MALTQIRIHDGTVTAIGLPEPKLQSAPVAAMIEEGQLYPSPWDCVELFAGQGPACMTPLGWQDYAEHYVAEPQCPIGQARVWGEGKWDCVADLHIKLFCRGGCAERTRWPRITNISESEWPLYLVSKELDMQKPVRFLFPHGTVCTNYGADQHDSDLVICEVER